MKKRLLALLLADVLIVGVTSIPAGAHTYDRAVEIHIQYGVDV